MFPDNYTLKLTERRNRNGTLGAGMFILAPQIDCNQLRWFFCQPGQSWPTDCQAEAIADLIREGRSAAIAFRRIADGIACFKQLAGMRA